MDRLIERRPALAQIDRDASETSGANRGGDHAHGNGTEPERQHVARELDPGEIAMVTNTKVAADAEVATLETRSDALQDELTGTEITAVWITLNPDKLHSWHRSP